MADQEFNTTGMIEAVPTTVPGTKSDGTPFVRIAYLIAGKKMSVFDNILPNYAEFKQGDIVDVVYTVSGKFNNIKTMTKSVTGNVPAQPVPTDEFGANREASIVAQVIIKRISDQVIAGKIETGHISNSCLQWAEHYKNTKAKLLEPKTE